jgi:hypothetical protein
MELQVVAMAGANHTLIVNGKGELYITYPIDYLSSIYGDIAPEPQSTLRLFFSQPTANRILQIFANNHHAAFVTKIGQMTKSFLFLSLKHGYETNVKP